MALKSWSAVQKVVIRTVALLEPFEAKFSSVAFPLFLFQLPQAETQVYLRLSF